METNNSEELQETPDAEPAQADSDDEAAQPQGEVREQAEETGKASEENAAPEGGPADGGKRAAVLEKDSFLDGSGMKPEEMKDDPQYKSMQGHFTKSQQEVKELQKKMESDNAIKDKVASVGKQYGYDNPETFMDDLTNVAQPQGGQPQQNPDLSKILDENKQIKSMLERQQNDSAQDRAYQTFQEDKQYLDEWTKANPKFDNEAIKRSLLVAAQQPGNEKKAWTQLAEETGLSSALDLGAKSALSTAENAELNNTDPKGNQEAPKSTVEDRLNGAERQLAEGDLNQQENVNLLSDILNPKQ